MGLLGAQLLVALPLAAVVLFPVWLIIKRIGFSPWLSLLMLVPLVNIATLYFIAFATWPDESS